MVQEYESVSTRLRGLGGKWLKGTGKVDRFVRRLEEKGELPPSLPGAAVVGRIFSHPDFDLDREARVVLVKGSDGHRAVRLRPQEFKILDLFSRNQDVVLKKEEVIRKVWPDSGGNAHLLTAHLSRMKYELGIYPGIETVRKVGYVLRSGIFKEERTSH